MELYVFGKYEEAALKFEEAISYFAYDDLYYLYLSLSLAKLGREEEIREVIFDGFNYVDSPELKFIYGDQLARERECESALRFFKLSEITELFGYEVKHYEKCFDPKRPFFLYLEEN